MQNRTRFGRPRLNCAVAHRAAAVWLEPLEPRIVLSGDVASVGELPGSQALFIENQGQWADSSVRYLLSRPGAQVAVTDSGPVFRVFDSQADGGSGRSAQFAASFVGRNVADAVITGQGPSSAVFNYAVGDAGRHRSGVAGYESVVYDDLYAGIDLQMWGGADHVKYAFHVEPFADPSVIAVRYSGIASLSIDESGALHVHLPDGFGELVDDAPYIFQAIGGQQVEVAGRFALIDANTYTISITGDYDASLPLVIDPQLNWSTYLGGGLDLTNDVAVDAAGNILVAGRTAASGWTMGGFDTTYNGGSGLGDGFVAKLAPGGALIWSTYIGGANDDDALGIAVDDAGNVLVSGPTRSPGWVSGGFDTEFNGSPYDGFVVKLSPDGSHQWSSYVAVTSGDSNGTVTVDSGGNVVVAGSRIVKLSPEGLFLWSTAFPGGSLGVAVDGSDHILVGGVTSTVGWTSGGYDTSYNGGGNDGFAAKLTPDGQMVWSTFVGGSSFDVGLSVQVDASDNVLLVGYTYSAGWASGGYDTTFDGGEDGFVVKLTPDGEHLWSTYLGTSEPEQTEQATDIAADAAGNVFVTGWTRNYDWLSGGPVIGQVGRRDAFLVKLTDEGSHVWSSPIGGIEDDTGNAIAVDQFSNIVVAGYSDRPGWTSRGLNTELPGHFAGFVVSVSDPVRLPFDFNLDGALSVGDIDALAYAVATGAGLFYDLNLSGQVDSADLDLVVHFLFNTEYGDANLDRKVDMDDLKVVAANFGGPGGWAQGNFNGVGGVNITDLARLATFFGFGVMAGRAAGDAESEPRVDVLAEAPAKSPPQSLVAVAPHTISAGDAESLHSGWGHIAALLDR